MKLVFKEIFLGKPGLSSVDTPVFDCSDVFLNISWSPSTRGERWQREPKVECHTHRDINNEA